MFTLLFAIFFSPHSSAVAASEQIGKTAISCVSPDQSQRVEAAVTLEGEIRYGEALTLNGHQPLFVHYSLVLAREETLGRRFYFSFGEGQDWELKVFDHEDGDYSAAQGASLTQYPPASADTEPTVLSMDCAASTVWSQKQP